MSLMCTFLAIFLPGSNAVVSLPTFREHFEDGEIAEPMVKSEIGEIM